MSERLTNLDQPLRVDTGAPSTVPELRDIVQTATTVFELMGAETPGAIVDLANTLIVSAHRAGAAEIESAASKLRQAASNSSPVVLAGAMHALGDAISYTAKKRVA